MTKGLICIDIDGTLTADRQRVSTRVVDYITKLSEAGYRLLFVTGRTFSWSMHLLQSFDIPYVLACLNGAYIIAMPGKRLVRSHDIALAELMALQPLVDGVACAQILLTSPISNEVSFLYDKHVPDALKVHLQARKRALYEKWIPIDTLDAITQDSFAALRIFCAPSDAERLAGQIVQSSGLQAASMRDSYDSRFSVVQVTASEASKGHALQEIVAQELITGPIIACGDDRNDISMFSLADCSIVMATALPDVLQHADIIAPPAENDGLIAGLDQALRW